LVCSASFSDGARGTEWDTDADSGSGPGPGIDRVTDFDSDRCPGFDSGAAAGAGTGAPPDTDAFPSADALASFPRGPAT
jgi:hypothetical protein